MRTTRTAVLALLLLAGSAATAATFYNPIVSAGQDPSVVQYNGYYYLAQSINSDTAIAVVKSRTLTGLASGTKVTVWTRPANTGPLCCEVWAPELQLINGTFYIYFAADDGNNANHRMYVLKANSMDPQGSWTLLGKIAAPTDRWAIDGTVMQLGSSLYFVWSGWEGTTNVQQNLYIAPMSNPYTLSGERVQISAPTNTWERIGGPPYINEGPEVLQRNGKTFIVYSASGSWTDDYCLGMLTATSTAVLSPGSWVKSSGCVFSKTATAYGPGHNTFVKSPNGAEDWMLYHADEVSGGGWAGRSIRAQKLNWNPDDTPNFGAPAGTTMALTVPAGEPLGSVRYEAEAATINHATTRTGAAGGASGGSVVGYIDYADSWVEFPRIWAPSAGTYALTVRFANGTLGTSTHNVSVNGGAAVALSYPVTGWDNWTSVALDVTLRAGDNTIRFTHGTAYAELDYVELNRYEAENAALNRADVRFAAGGASSERVAGHIDFADSWVELRNVTVPSAGTYRVRAGYANGSTGTATHLVSVNGGASVTLSYAKGGWDNWRTSTISVNLNAGANTIRFTKGTNYAELDCVEIFK